jgi:quercetin dioxygenase-like cupin family protein
MLGKVRRVVTGHDQNGRAIVKIDALIEGTKIPHVEGYFIVPWTTDRSPADNMDTFDGAKREVGLTCPDGSVLRITDLGPGLQSPMHRTKSVDYGIVLEGEIDLLLDSGETVNLKAGDVVVQRGTIHAWVNRTDKWCRIAFILIDAELVAVNNVVLEPTD